MKQRYPTIRMSACATLALMLAACASEKPAPRTVMQAPAALADGQTLVATRTAPEWPGAAWWQRFGDPQLNHLVSQALIGSPSLAQAEARVDDALAAAGASVAALRPHLDASGSFSYQRLTETQFFPPPWGGNRYWNNDLVLNASLDLDIWGRQHQLLKAAQDRGRMAAAEADEAREALVDALVRSYIQLALLQSQADLLTRELALQNDQVSLAHRRYGVGLGTQLELTQAQSRIPVVSAELDEINGNLAVTRLQLAALSGQGPAAAQQLAAPVIDLTRRPEVPEVVPVRWLGRRPDVVARRWQVEVGSHELEAAHLSFYPDINLSAYVGYQALGLNDLLTHNSRIYGVTPAFSLPIFEGGRLKAAQFAKAAERDAAIAAYNDTLLTAARQVTSLVAGLKALDAQTEEAGRSVALADQSAALTRRGLKAGLVERAKVLDTELAVLNEQRRLDQLRAHRLDVVVQLIRATGGESDDAGNGQAE